jgi:hypothetical protein
VLHGAVVFLVRAGAVIASVVAGVCPGIGGAGLLVKQLLPGLDPVAITMSLVPSIEESSIFLAGSVGQDNDASAADNVASWLPARGRDRAGPVAFVSRVEFVRQRAGPIAQDA